MAGVLTAREKGWPSGSSYSRACLIDLREAEMARAPCDSELDGESPIFPSVVV